MRVLVACEFSGTVREAFRRRGHDAWSCDLLETEQPSPYHVVGNVLDVLWGHPDGAQWDLLIAHPPCTDLAVSGARHFPAKRADGRQQRALAFVKALLDAPVPRIALENPVSVISSQIRKPDQIVQPFHFGDPYRKTTCLWLRNLPRLVPTSTMTTGEQKCWLEPPHPDRWKRRSRTYPGLAEAMADQWGALEQHERGDVASGF
jgi:site-specific DNA-cytosine methylase